MPSIKSRQSIPTGDERHSERWSSPTADSLKESQLAAGRGALTSGRTSRTSQIQTASLKESISRRTVVATVTAVRRGNRRRFPAVRFRLELFVENLDVSIRFYETALGFHLVRRQADYASLQRRDRDPRLGAIAELPVDSDGPGFTQAGLTGVRGAGVEIVLEVEDVDAALADVAGAGGRVVEPLRDRPWGLRDFRLIDPDGYYLRVTHA
jgi:lactoylglutathione lyase